MISKQRIRVMICTPFYSPNSIVGAKRFAFLAKQFCDLGYDVSVLSLRQRAGSAVDPTLPTVSKNFSVRSLLPYEFDRKTIRGRLTSVFWRFFRIPDQYIGWLVPSVVKGYKVAKRERPDVIIATGPPFTAFLTGVLLKKRIGCHLILDYRDPWAAYDWDEYGKTLRGRICKRLERWAVGSADALVFVSDVMSERFTANYEGPDPKAGHVISNGFDEVVGEPLDLGAGTTNVMYAGNFYGSRRVVPLVKALNRLEKESNPSACNFRLHVFGSIPSDERSLIESAGLRHLVVEHQPVDHETVRRFMLSADILYLPSGQEVAYALPFKVFDYLSVRRPILAVTPSHSAAARLVRNLRCGEVSEEDTEESIAAAIELLLSTSTNYDYSGIQGFSWQKIALQYDSLLQNMVASGSQA